MSENHDDRKNLRKIWAEQGYKPTAMEKQWAAYWADPEGYLAEEIPTINIKPPKYFFFYGPFKDPEILAEVLGREPVLLKAHSFGYHVKLADGWLPALVGGYPGERLDGMACWVETEEEEKKLLAFANHGYPFRYYASGCNVYLEDGSKHSGMAFYWGLEWYESPPLSEGTFDLERWKVSRAKADETP